MVGFYHCNSELDLWLTCVLCTDTDRQMVGLYYCHSELDRLGIIFQWLASWIGAEEICVSHPEMTQCSWWDGKIQELTNSVS